MFLWFPQAQKLEVASPFPHFQGFQLDQFSYPRPGLPPLPEPREHTPEKHAWIGWRRDMTDMIKDLDTWVSCLCLLHSDYYI
jgi:hypothetical protein